MKQLADHYAGYALQSSICDTCLERTNIRGGFNCPLCQHGMTHEVTTIGVYSSPIALTLHRHKEHFTLFTERNWVDAPLPLGALRVVSSEYALQVPEHLIVYPFPTRDERLVDMAVAKLERYKANMYYPGVVISRERVAGIIFS
jgi:hypothetical protein